MAQFLRTTVVIILGFLVHQSHQGFLSGGTDRANNNGNQLGGQNSPPHSLMEALQESGGFRVSGPYQVSAPFSMPSGSFSGPVPFQGSQGGFHGSGNSQDGNGGNFGGSGGFQSSGNFARHTENFQGPRGFQGSGNFQGPGNFQGSGNFQGPTGFQGQSNFHGQGGNFQGQSGFGGQGNFPASQRGFQDGPGGPLSFRSQFSPSLPPRAPDTPHVSIQPASVKVVYVPVVSTSIKASSLSKLTGEPTHGKDSTNSYFTGSGQTGPSQQEVSKPSSYSTGIGSYGVKPTGTGKVHGHTGGGHATIPIIIIQKEHHPGVKTTQPVSFPAPTSQGPQSQQGSSATAGDFSKQTYDLGSRGPTQAQHHQPRGHQEHHQRQQQRNQQAPNLQDQHTHHQQHHQQVAQQQQQQQHQDHHQHQQQVVGQRAPDHGHDSAHRNAHGGTGAVIPVIIIQKTLQQTAGRQQHQHHQHQSGGYNVPAAPPPVRGPTAWSPWR